MTPDPASGVRLIAVPTGTAAALRAGDAAVAGRLRPAPGWPWETTLAVLELGIADRLVLLDGEVVGECGVKAVDAHGVAELGWGLCPAVRGRGVASATVRLLVADALTRPGVRAVEAQVGEDNAASLRAARAGGLVDVGAGEPGHRLLRQRLT